MSKARTNVEVQPNPNLLINGGFNIWQRGTAWGDGSNPSQPNLAWGYQSDRWWTANFASAWAGTFDAAEMSLNQYPSTNFFAWTKNGDIGYIDQVIENGLQWVAGKTVTVSFICQAEDSITTAIISDRDRAANWGQANFTYTPRIEGSGFLATATINVTDTIVSTPHACSLRLVINNGIDHRGNGRWLTAIKLELGDTATPFVNDTPEVNLAKCQRYYEAVNGALTSACIYTTGAVYAPLQYMTPKRGAATVVVTRCNFFAGGSNQALTFNSTTTGSTIRGTRLSSTGNSGLANGQGGWIDIDYTADAEFN